MIKDADLLNGIKSYNRVLIKAKDWLTNSHAPILDCIKWTYGFSITIECITKSKKLNEDGTWVNR